MSTKHKNRHRGATQLPSAGPKTVAGTFRMVVAANPGSEVTLAPELDLVKAALLYGDEVTLLSPVTTMFLRVEGLQRFSVRQQLELIRRVAPVLVEPDQLSEFQAGLAKVDDLLRTSAGGGSLGDHFLRAAVLQQFEPVLQELQHAIQGLSHRAGVDQLAPARANGLVKIESTDPGDALDLLVYCVMSAKLAGTGQRHDNPYAHRIVEQFVDKLSRYLSSGREYLIFDEPIASLTEAAIREGLFAPAKGPVGRSAQAMTASALLGRLPTFPSATVDEVLDIRTELAPALIRFRSAMVTIAKTFTSAPWQSGFEDEVHDAWVETVWPAVEAIYSSVQDNTSLLSLAAGMAGAVNTSWPGLAIVGAGLLGHAGAVAAVGGAFSGGVPLLQALRDQRSTGRDIRMQPFYFLYAVEHSLS